MNARLHDIVSALDAELRTSEIPDYPGAVNGLQVANNGKVERVAVAVDASHAAINAAISERANMLLVHHGLFWSGVQPLTGLAYEKYRALIANDIAVYSSHLPLDMHAERFGGIVAGVDHAHAMLRRFDGGVVRALAHDQGVDAFLACLAQ